MARKAEENAAGGAGFLTIFSFDLAIACGWRRRMVRARPASINILAALSNISQRLVDLAVGVRATQILLEQVSRKPDQGR